MKDAADFFAKFAKPGACFALYGDLGYGKTVFAEHFIKTLNPTVENVPSPTFTIIQTYECRLPSGPTEIWHTDCYRLNDPNEFYELGLEEACRECITIIEWPEIIRELLPKNTIEIRFSLKENDLRIISFENPSIG
jgi:tRNA threonylcarbamoyladenosine biosynthesis protein TsaE